ncbi:tyrosine-type recombinase/integrase [Mailhella sp.]
MQGNNRLSDTAVKKAKPSEKIYKLCDGDKLYLFVMPSGKKIWRVLWREEGKDKQFTIGEYPAISLRMAREERTRVKGLVALRLDPNDEKKWKLAQAEHEAVVQSRTFEAVAREWHERKTVNQSENSRKLKLQRLIKHVFPHIGSILITELTRPDLVKTLMIVEEGGTSDMPKRVAGIMDAVCRYACDVGYTDKYFSHSLCRSLSRRAIRGHRAAITSPEEVKHLLLDIDNYGGDITTCYALRIMPYVFVRSFELRGARWDEFDFEKRIWTIPASRMKMRKAHIVPLARQVEVLLHELHQFTGDSELLFPSSISKTRCLTDVGLLNALRRLGYPKDKMCIHGFRSMASTLLNELGYRPDVIEAQLAHEEKNAVRAAYNRARYMPERIQMMQEWADWLDALKKKRRLPCTAKVRTFNPKQELAPAVEPAPIVSRELRGRKKRVA